MQFRLFTVSIGDPGGCDELNRFLAGHRVLTVQRELIQNGSGSCWAFCLEYLDTGRVSGGAGSSRRPKIDYKEVLPPAQFAVFARLRECRKGLAAKEGLPAFAVCTDEQLAAMAREETLDKGKLLAIDGFGEGKAERYAEALVEAHAGDKKQEMSQP